MTKRKIRYHPLADFFPMLPDMEFDRLKASIEDIGQLEPITLIEGKILDGRNRYEACLSLGIEPKFRDFDSAEPLEFVFGANIRRRHLSPGQRVQIEFDIFGPPVPGSKNRSYTAIAKSLGVHRRTVEQVARFQDDPDIKDQIRDGTISPGELISGVSPFFPREGNDEWYTPREYIESARKVMLGIDLDPGTSKEAQRVVRAKKFYTMNDDALEQEWHGRVWMNPPFSKNQLFNLKLQEEYAAGRVTEAIILVGVFSSATRWFEMYWNETLCFCKERILFYQPGGEPIRGNIAGSVFVYLGPKKRKFAQIFKKHGIVVREWPQPRRKK